MDEPVERRHVVIGADVASVLGIVVEVLVHKHAASLHHADHMPIEQVARQLEAVRRISSRNGWHLPAAAHATHPRIAIQRRTTV